MSVAFILAFVLLQADAAPAPVSDEEALAVTHGRISFEVDLDAAFVVLPGVEGFYRRAGPFDGCDAVNSARQRIGDAYYPRYRVQQAAAVREAVPARVIRAAAARGPSSPMLRDYDQALFAAQDRRTGQLVAAAAAELKTAVDGWLAGYRGVGEAGLNSAGIPFWRRNLAATRDLCRLSREMRRGVLHSWSQAVGVDAAPQ